VSNVDLKKSQMSDAEELKADLSAPEKEAFLQLATFSNQSDITPTVHSW